MPDGEVPQATGHRLDEAAMDKDGANLTIVDIGHF